MDFNNRGVSANPTPPIFSPINTGKPASPPPNPTGGTGDPFGELLKQELGSEEVNPGAAPVADEGKTEAGMTQDEAKAYKAKLAQMSVEDLKKERERITEQIDKAVGRGDVKTLKKAQKKYELITQAIREKFSLDVVLAQSKPSDDATRIVAQKRETKDDIIKKLQQMDITVPKDQSAPPVNAPQMDKTFVEPSTYSSNSTPTGNYTNSNVQIFSWNPNQSVSPNYQAQVNPQQQVPQQSPQVMGFTPTSPNTQAAFQNLNNYMANQPSLSMMGNIPGLNSIAGDPRASELLRRSAELNTLSAMLSTQPGMGFTDPNANNSPWLNLYGLMMSGKAMPQTMADLGVFPAINSALMSEGENKDDNW